MSHTRIKPVLFTGKKYADGTSPILIRITTDRKSNYIKTGYSVLPVNWYSQEDKVYEIKPRLTEKLKEQLSAETYKDVVKQFKAAIVLDNARKINADIADQITDLNNLKRKMEVNDQSISSDILKKQLSNKYSVKASSDIFQFSQKVIDNLKDMKKVGTFKRYRTIIARLKEFHPGTLRFEEITHSFLNDYEMYLIKEGYMTNYIHNHLKTIKALFRQAIQEGVTSQQHNPFFTYKLKIDSNTRKEKLTELELNKIKAFKAEKNSALWHTRNYFLFSFYMAGIRVSDLMQLKWKDVQDGRIEYNMDKTGGYKSIKVHVDLYNILANYETKDRKPEDFIFPFLDNDQDYSDAFVLKGQISSKTTVYNSNLKKLATAAEITKNLTTHIARHTFADLARKKGAAVYDVSKALGHSSIRITENYLSRFDEESLDNAMENIFKKL